MKTPSALAISAKQHNLIDYAAQHSFDAVAVAGDAVAVVIPYVNIFTRETGHIVETVRTMSELRIALGY
jgi:hypothetical protein